MTKTKHALAVSFLSVLLCCAMLIGTTFAWFSDSAASGNNKVVAGKLDVELEYAAAFDADGTPTAWESAQNADNLFHPAKTEDTLWEPGHTEVVYLRVRNAGNLALKYNLTAAVYADAFGAPEKSYENKKGGFFKLSDYLVFNMIPDTATRLENRTDAWLTGGQTAEEAALGRLDSIAGKDVVLDKGEEKVFTLAVYMPAWIGNEANYKTGTAAPEIYVSLALVATQAAVESDSFGHDYDKDAEYPTVYQMALADGSASFTFPGKTPAGEEATTVTFPAGSFTSGDKLALVVDAAPIDADMAENYPEINGFSPIGSVKLTLRVNGEIKTDFNGMTAVVETYAAKESEDVTVRYTHDGVADNDEYITAYDAETGKLTFETDHFSEFTVYAASSGTPEYQYSATLLTGMNLNLAIKNTANGTSGTNFRVADNTVKSITFCTYDKEIIGADWEEGKPVDAENEGALRLFFVGGNENAYICAKPDTQICMNESSSYMFMNMYALSTIDFGGDLLSTADVTSMLNLFNGCTALGDDTFAQTGSWDVSRVSDMGGMFRGCELLTEIDLSGWNTASLTSISSMFMGDTALAAVNVSGWDASGIAKMDSAFANCYALQTITGMSDWRADHVTNMSQMFHTCKTLTELDLRGFNVSAVTKLDSVFSNCYALQKIEGLNGWDTSKVTDASSLFFNCYALTELDLTGFVKSSTTNISSMFNSCKALEAVVGMDTWDTSGVRNMGSLFSGCEAIKTLDLSGWDTANVTDMSAMFQNCCALKELTVADWTVRSGTKTTFMFNSCSALERIYTNQDWAIRGTSTYIFYNCNSLVGGNETKWAKSYESNANYARIDRDGTKGFFTDIADKI